jgi:hypothetical protein
MVPDPLLKGSVVRHHTLEAAGILIQVSQDFNVMSFTKGELFSCPVQYLLDFTVLPELHRSRGCAVVFPPGC